MHLEAQQVVVHTTSSHSGMTLILPIQKDYVNLKEKNFEIYMYFSCFSFKYCIRLLDCYHFRLSVVVEVRRKVIETRLKKYSNCSLPTL